MWISFFIFFQNHIIFPLRLVRHNDEILPNPSFDQTVVFIERSFDCISMFRITNKFSRLNKFLNSADASPTDTSDLLPIRLVHVSLLDDGMSATNRVLRRDECQSKVRMYCIHVTLSRYCTGWLLHLHCDRQERQ